MRDQIENTCVRWLSKHHQNIILVGESHLAQRQEKRNVEKHVVLCFVVIVVFFPFGSMDRTRSVKQHIAFMFVLVIFLGRVLIAMGRIGRGQDDATNSHQRRIDLHLCNTFAS